MHWLLLFLGILFFGAGVGGFLYVRNAKNNWDESTAQITDVKEFTRRVKDKNGRYRTCVSYRITYCYVYQGQSYFKDRNSTSRSSRSSIGQSVTVFVNPNNPEKVYYPGSGDMIMIWCLIAVGLFMGIVAIYQMQHL